jgi:hypothetical protein
VLRQQRDETEKRTRVSNDERDVVVYDGNTYVVETRQRAKDSRVVGGVERTFVVDTVDELWIDDGSVNPLVLFQCVHPNRDDCEYTSITARSVTAHQRSHGPKTTARRLRRELTAREKELAAEKKRKDEQHKRRSAGVKRGVDERKQRHAAEATHADPKIHAVQIKLSDFANEIGKVCDLVNGISTELRKLNTEVAKLKLVANADPVIIEKAKQYDIIKGALNA